MLGGQGGGGEAAWGEMVGGEEEVGGPWVRFGRGSGILHTGGLETGARGGAGSHLDGGLEHLEEGAVGGAGWGGRALSCQGLTER